MGEALFKSTVDDDLEEISRLLVLGANPNYVKMLPKDGRDYAFTCLLFAS